MDFQKRHIAITDVETTGLDFHIHEIVEIGLIVIDQKTFKVIDEWNVKVKPSHIKTGAASAIKFCGYNKLDWANAMSLKEAMEIYSKKTKNAIFLAQNSFFDWSFISEAFKDTGVEDHTDYHRVDLFSIGWSKQKDFPKLKEFSLSGMCRYFEIPKEPMPHRAVNGARKAYEVLKKLMNSH
jgi:DNA polymerase III alpha subunit (gram-positive type)